MHDDTKEVFKKPMTTNEYKKVLVKAESWTPKDENHDEVPPLDLETEVRSTPEDHHELKGRMPILEGPFEPNGPMPSPQGPFERNGPMPSLDGPY